MSKLFENIKLLVADDNYENVELILGFLEDLTDDIVYAPDGQLAVELTQQEPPDLIIMDWQMPKMNGIEAIKAIRGAPDTTSIPIIVATGIMTSVDNLRMALESGAVDFLRKPYNKLEFQARCEAALRLRHQHLVIEEMLAKEKEFMQQTLEHKRRELAGTAVFEFQKSMLLGQLLKHLDQLDSKTNFVHATDIKSIGQELTTLLNLDQSWESFEEHFEEVHPGFLSRLSQQFPVLNIRDKKLCANLKMGLGNYELAQLSGTSDSAVKKSINRLKKKMDFGPEIDLRKFLFDL